MVDLDANRIAGPTVADRDGNDFIPALPEPEASILRNHLKQVSFLSAWQSYTLNYNRSTRTIAFIHSNQISKAS